MDKVRENRARRYAKRQGLILKASRKRLPHVDDLGGYQLVDARTHRIRAGEKFSLTMEEVEAILKAGDEELKKIRK